jgi:transcriptional regulator
LNWILTVKLLKGTLDVLILKTLSREPMHGYAMSRRIRDTTESVFTVEEGALYPALRRLEQKGLLRARWGQTDTGREAKFYALTRAGRRQLETGLAAWDRYVEAMSRVLD